MKGDKRGQTGTKGEKGGKGGRRGAALLAKTPPAPPNPSLSRAPASAPPTAHAHTQPKGSLLRGGPGGRTRALSQQVCVLADT